MLISTPVSNLIETSRKPKFFLFNYIQPSVLINLLALFVFLIPAESGRNYYKCHHHYAKSSLFWSLPCSLMLAKLTALYSQVTTRKIISGIIIMITIPAELQKRADREDQSVLIFGKSRQKTGENTRKQAKSSAFLVLIFFVGKIGRC